MVPNLYGTRDRFRGRQFFHGAGGMVQAVMRAMGSDGELQMRHRSLACRSPPAVQPVPNRPRTSTGLQPGGWGTPGLHCCPSKGTGSRVCCFDLENTEG